MHHIRATLIEWINWKLDFQRKTKSYTQIYAQNKEIDRKKTELKTQIDELKFSMGVMKGLGAADLYNRDVDKGQL